MVALKKVLAGTAFAALYIGCASILAPRITDTDIHKLVSKREECLSCHLEGKKGAPVAPARMLEPDRHNCVRCHK
ncbi:MAG: hypothetical protein L0Y74_00355 [candidate division Zixibacteria bacterium]|nr:hypothetical protein [candidate division Zixibacteria bacterium]